jgi:hypothetical protein
MVVWTKHPANHISEEMLVHKGLKHVNNIKFYNVLRLYNTVMHFLHTAELTTQPNLFYQKYKIKNVFSPISNAILGQMSVQI